MRDRDSGGDQILYIWQVGKHWVSFYAIFNWGSLCSNSKRNEDGFKHTILLNFTIS